MFQLNIHWYRFENLITSSSSLKILFEEIFKRFFDLSLLKYLLNISSNNIFSDRHNPDRVIFNLSSSSYENNIIISLYMLSWKQCALPVITTMALWQLMHFVVITGRAHCFHDNTYITPILLLWDLSTLCVMDHLWPLIISLYYYIILLY